MRLFPGAKLGPYEILSPAGAGGMGEVYRGRDTRLDRTVAIKVLPERLSSNAELKQRFEREARAISQLQHPHILCALRCWFPERNWLLGHGVPRRRDAR